MNYYQTVSNIFMGIVPYRTMLSEITKDTIDNFVTTLMDKGTKTTSLNTYLRGVRAVMYYLIAEEFVQPFKIQKIRCDEEIKETFSKDEIKLLLKKPNLLTMYL